MAIQNNYESIFSASFKEAYHKIISADYDFQTNKVTFRVAVYTNKGARDNNFPPLPPIRKVTCDIIADPRPDLYTYLSTTPDYQESENV